MKFRTADGQIYEVLDEPVWEPMKTAPRDGREIILTDGYHIGVAYWDRESWPNADQANACWSISDWHNDPIHLRGGYAATHWMPRPRPPKE